MTSQSHLQRQYYYGSNQDGRETEVLFPPIKLHKYYPTHTHNTSTLVQSECISPRITAMLLWHHNLRVKLIASQRYTRLTCICSLIANATTGHHCCLHCWQLKCNHTQPHSFSCVLQRLSSAFLLPSLYAVTLGRTFYYALEHCSLCSINNKLPAQHVQIDIVLLINIATYALIHD